MFGRTLAAVDSARMDVRQVGNAQRAGSATAPVRPEEHGEQGVANGMANASGRGATLGKSDVLNGYSFCGG
jgi:hypothetical protein